MVEMCGISRISSGFVTLPRDFLNWEWYSNANTVRVFLHLLLKANFANARWQGIEVKRGQVVTSLQNIAAELNISIQNVRTALKKLQKSGYLTIKSTNKFTIVTVVNYELFQGSNASNNTQIDNPLTNSQQTDNNQLTINQQQLNNNKNGKKKKKNISSSAADGVTSFDGEFETVWEFYPRKQGKEKAKSAYIKARKQGTSQQTIVDGLNKYIHYIEQNHTDPKYIKYGSTWFSERCWDDEYNRATSAYNAQTPAELDYTGDVI